MSVIYRVQDHDHDLMQSMVFDIDEWIVFLNPNNQALENQIISKVQLHYFESVCPIGLDDELDNKMNI
jgi:hypothetical protein